MVNPIGVRHYNRFFYKTFIHMNLLYTLAVTSVYIFNSRGQYLSVGEDGKPVLSKNRLRWR